MPENFSLKNCSDDDALFCKDKGFKIIQIKEAVKQAFCGELGKALYELLNSYGVQLDPGGSVVGNKFYRDTKKLFEEGIYCEILKLGAKNWQKGNIRIKVTLEFIPDESSIIEPESPLDELRQIINQNNS
ncbi:KGK domain protein [Nodularia spumigena CENA596]|uniref:KGK domain protein n=1 Tax=Nodularia spumigena CENA596 TaxID=1819295 RepID=A0A166I779_NODSP|nr:KGK domain-containing protein [Nodularia spumigena]KZL48000.1 KGK domain protein [Nodularia spumigena CENA596]